MFIDVITLILVILAFFKGFRKGLIVAIFSFLGFIIGLAAALKLSTVAASYISDNANVSHRWLPVLAFLVVFIIVILLVRIGAKLIESVARVAMLGWLNRLGGVVFYALIYLFIFSIFLFYTVQLHLIKPETTEASVTYPVIKPIAPAIMDAMGTILPFFKNMFKELLEFFQNLSDKHHPA
jgi:membrane protein required for colicin V production